MKLHKNKDNAYKHLSRFKNIDNRPTFLWLCLYLVGIVDDERSPLLDSPPVAHFALTSTKTLGLVDLFNISPGLDIASEEDHGLLGLGEALDLVCHDQWNLGDAINAVACYKHKTGQKGPFLNQNYEK